LVQVTSPVSLAVMPSIATTTIRMCSTLTLLGFVAFLACHGLVAGDGQALGPVGGEDHCRRTVGSAAYKTVCSGAARWGSSSDLHPQGPSFLQVQHWRSSTSGLIVGDGFEPVDGGTNRACRGADSNDNSDSYYTLFNAMHSIDQCKAKCRGVVPDCRGIEYHGSGRCEVWTRALGVGVSVAWPGATCLRALSHSQEYSMEFEPLNVGRNRACRGADLADNSASDYELHLSIASLGACKEKCLRTPACQGVEFHRRGGRCEVWTRSQGIGATLHMGGYTCLRYGPAATATATSTSTAATTTTITTTMTTSTTTSTATTTAFPTPLTTKGCACMESWILTDFPEDGCENYCCNPDSDPGGYWCIVSDAQCQGTNWGYCAAPPPPTTPAPVRQTSPPSDIWQVLPIEWEHFNVANELRRQGYRCPLGNYYPPNPVAMVFDCRLWQAAKGHSQDMADQNYFSHTALDGRSFWDRARAQGISANAENIAASCTTADCALDQFKLSDPHCNNLMQAGLKMFAVGVAYNGNSDWKFYWTQLFTAGEVAADTSCYPASQAAATDDISARPLHLERRPVHGSKTGDKALDKPVLPGPWAAHRAVGTSKGYK